MLRTAGDVCYFGPYSFFKVGPFVAKKLLDCFPSASGRANPSEKRRKNKNKAVAFPCGRFFPGKKKKFFQENLRENETPELPEPGRAAWPGKIQIHRHWELSESGPGYVDE